MLSLVSYALRSHLEQGQRIAAGVHGLLWTFVTAVFIEIIPLRGSSISEDFRDFGFVLVFA